MKLILASASPRRLDLLKDIGIVPDQVLPADIEEIHEKGESPKAYAIRLAREKAAHVAAQNPDALVLGSDTVVMCAQKILHKAKNEDDVKVCLKALSGRRHHVYTAVALCLPDGTVLERCSDSWVKFKRVDDLELTDYAASGEGIGKAGGYAIQGKAACLIKEISGSYSSIVGLPLYETAQMLKQAGVKF